MKIGLTYTGSEIKHQNYINWLKADDHIEILTLSAAANNAIEIDSCDGLVLSGGIDVLPELYGNSNHNYSNAPAIFQPERDEFETVIFNNAQKNNIPVLGICRGFQLINCILGGSLIQDLGESLNTIHWGEQKSNDKAHGVTIEQKTLFAEIISTDRAVVNSAHHQAIDNLGDGLMINCIADDGTVEGFEWNDKTDKPFMLAVQWHPERMYQFQLENAAVSKNIRDRFVEEIKKSIQTKHLQLS